jgi:universal stress protein A
MEPTTLRSPTPPAIRLKRILVPVDFSDPSSQALRYAARFAQHFGGELTLLHVMQKTAIAAFPEVPTYVDYPEEDFEKAERALQSLAAQQPLRSSVIHTDVRTGLAAHEIVEAARDLDSDLIVIATHGYTGWKHLCIGSTAERVVRTAPCPVFVVRENQHELFS